MSEVEKFASNIKNLEKIALLEESEHTGGEITPEEIRGRLNGGNVVLKPTNRGWSLTQMIQVMMLIQEIVFDMCWAFLLAPDGDPVLRRTIRLPCSMRRALMFRARDS